ncbi:MAG TPA: multicopper oxidase domain-containing protein, partial [Nitrolancea sp.]|nr:multicopper oxidase domain-containing protein [Nitrolancea sp.]
MNIRADVQRNKVLDRIRQPREDGEMDTKEGKLMPGQIIRMLKPRPFRVSAFGVPFAFGGLWLHLLHQVSGADEHHEPLTVLHWLRDSTLALPLVLVAVVIAMALSDRLIRCFHAHDSGRLAGVARAAVSAAMTSVAAAAALPVHELLFHMAAGHHGGPAMPFLVDIGRDGLFTIASLGIAGLLAVVLANRRRAHPHGVSRARPARGRRLGGIPARCVRVAAAAAIAASLVPMNSLVPTQPFVAGSVAAASSCAAGSANRSYDVVAINVTIPFNRWGQTDPNGQIFALKGDAEAIKNWSKPLAADLAQDPAGNRRLRPRPLVLRANAGECVEVTLTNQLNATGNDGLPNNPSVSIHVNGPSYNVQTSDGSAVGYNDDTTVPMGGSITYYWSAPEEGLYFFHDRAGFAGSEADGGSNVHGLYGALAVEPAGSTWTDPVSGQPLYSGTGGQSGDLYINAVIKPMNGMAFRESIQISQDEIPGVGFGFNYGVESMQVRAPEYQRCPDCISEETVLSSWPYGDPALIKLASGPGPWKPAPGNTNVEDCGLPDSCYVSNVTHAYAHD